MTVSAARALAKQEQHQLRPAGRALVTDGGARLCAQPSAAQCLHRRRYGHGRPQHNSRSVSTVHYTSQVTLCSVVQGGAT